MHRGGAGKDWLVCQSALVVTTELRVLSGLGAMTKSLLSFSDVAFTIGRAAQLLWVCGCPVQEEN